MKTRCDLTLFWCQTISWGTVDSDFLMIAFGQISILTQHEVASLIFIQKSIRDSQTIRLQTSNSVRTQRSHASSTFNHPFIAIYYTENKPICASTFMYFQSIFCHSECAPFKGQTKVSARVLRLCSDLLSVSSALQSTKRQHLQYREISIAPILKLLSSPHVISFEPIKSYDMI